MKLTSERYFDAYQHDRLIFGFRKQVKEVSNHDDSAAEEQANDQPELSATDISMAR